jgi:hypothetical protein
MKTDRYKVAIGVILCWTLTLISCKKEEKIVQKGIYNDPLSELHGINMAYTDSAKIMVKMSTETQLTLQNEDKVYPKEVRIFFFDKLGNNTTTPQRRFGKIYSLEKPLSYYGACVGK